MIDRYDSSTRLRCRNPSVHRADISNYMNIFNLLKPSTWRFKDMATVKIKGERKKQRLERALRTKSIDWSSIFRSKQSEVGREEKHLFRIHLKIYRFHWWTQINPGCTGSWTVKTNILLKPFVSSRGHQPLVRGPILICGSFGIVPQINHF